MNSLRTATRLASRPQQRISVISNQLRTMASSDLNIEALKSLKVAPGVNLSEEQKTLTASVLDLFAGKATLAKLDLWKDDCTFEDPIAIAKGRKQVDAQWYGLQSAFSQITQLEHQVVSAGNPVEVDMKTLYKVKGLGKETTVSSRLNVFIEAGKIAKVEDKWNGNLPDSSIADVFRSLNGRTMPNVVGVPKNAEEDAKREVPKN